MLRHETAGLLHHVGTQAELALLRLTIHLQAQHVLQHQLLHHAVGGDVVHIHILHHDVERLLGVSGSPLPALTAGLRETPRLLPMGGVVFAGHVHTVLLHVIAVVAEAVHVLIAHLHARLHQLVILVVTHRQRGIEGSRHKQIDVLGEAHPLIVQMVLDAHADGQLSEAHAPDAHVGALLLQRVFTTCRDDDHRIVHRCLQDIHQGDAVVDNLQRLTDLQRRRLAFVLAQAAHGRLSGRRVFYLHLHSRLTVKALGLGHVIARKLGLCRPLRGKHDGPVLCRHSLNHAHHCHEKVNYLFHSIKFCVQNYNFFGKNWFILIKLCIIASSVEKTTTNNTKFKQQ